MYCSYEFVPVFYAKKKQYNKDATRVLLYFCMYVLRLLTQYAYYMDTRTRFMRLDHVFFLLFLQLQLQQPK